MRPLAVAVAVCVLVHAALALEAPLHDDDHVPQRVRDNNYVDPHDFELSEEGGADGKSTESDVQNAKAALVPVDLEQEDDFELSDKVMPDFEQDISDREDDEDQEANDDLEEQADNNDDAERNARDDDEAKDDEAKDDEANNDDVKDDDAQLEEDEDDPDEDESVAVARAAKKAKAARPNPATVDEYEMKGADAYDDDSEEGVRDDEDETPVVQKQQRMAEEDLDDSDLETSRPGKAHAKETKVSKTSAKKHSAAPKPTAKKAVPAKKKPVEKKAEKPTAHHRLEQAKLSSKKAKGKASKKSKKTTEMMDLEKELGPHKTAIKTSPSAAAKAAASSTKAAKPKTEAKKHHQDLEQPAKREGHVKIKTNVMSNADLEKVEKSADQVHQELERRLAKLESERLQADHAAVVEEQHRFVDLERSFSPYKQHKHRAHRRPGPRFTL